ncbi:MAG: DUF3147 family protein [Spirochaetota bacterium]
MAYYLMKVGISAIVIVMISEAAKRSSLFGAIIASLPLTSLLAILWMHYEQVKIEKIINLSKSVFWLVLPSLAFFLLFPALLNRGLHFWGSFSISAATTIVLYFLLVWALKFFNMSMG